MGMSQHDLELLAKYENDLMTTLNLTYLLPHLTNRGLLTSNEADLLTKPELTRQDAIKKFLSILKTKGQTAFFLFTDALGNEKAHLGHASLYKMLTCHAQEKRTSMVEDNEPHPPATASIRQSTSAHNLHCDSGISQGSSSASSATSVGSVALSSGLQLATFISASMQPQLDSIKDQVGDNARSISELTKRIETLHRDTSSLRTSSSLSAIPRRKSFSQANFESQSYDQPSSTSSRQSTKRLTRSITCSFPVIKVSYSIATV